MAVQALREEAPSNPRTLDEARQLVKHVESLFMPWNIDALVDGFTEDCVIRFGTLGEFRGREALRAFFTARSRRQKNYRLTKQVRTLDGERLTNLWTGDWEDTETGTAMKGFGIEVWTMREGRIAIWEAAFNVAPVASEMTLADMLR
ncbi:MAG: nuclear transport factor 2 family protein [Alphaproteobacteria bacterium]|nr:nuclear transport factor 2 family protein [Alphaproteobacteria bacterium]